MPQTPRPSGRSSLLLFFLATAVALLGIIGAGPAQAQSITGLTVSSDTSSGDNFNDGITDSYERKHTITTTPSGASFTSRYAYVVGTDTGVFTSRSNSLSANYTLSFTVTAPGSYSLSVNTNINGALTLVNDGSASATASQTAVTGGQTGGTLASGGLGLSGPSTLSSNSGGNTPFAFSNSATITGVSNGSPVVHTLSFSWTSSCSSSSGITGGDECAVRGGLPITYGGESAGDYPGTGGRNQATDGHLVSVTLTSFCGNGTLDAGEACDLGGLNGNGASCCTSSCQFRPAGQSCRGPADVCDQAETCTGSSGACPADLKVAAGTACASDGNACTLDQCDGTNNACQHPAGNAGATCRSSAGACDVAETCNGVSTICPGDTLVTAGTECRPSAGACDPAESCDGSNPACPGDAVASAGTECRAAGGTCDIAESCDGVGTACPADVKVSAGTECRAAGGACDVAESCDGSDPACPADVLVTAGTECRAAAGVCDVAESCDGSDPACPADSLVAAPSDLGAGGSASQSSTDVGGAGLAIDGNTDGDFANGSVSRTNAEAEASWEVDLGSVASIDAIEVWNTDDGTEANLTGYWVVVSDIPFAGPSLNDALGTAGASGYFNAGQAARPSTVQVGRTGQYVRVQLTGTAALTLAEVNVLQGTVCRGAAGACDVADLCDGSGVDCPVADVKQTVECRPGAGVCDVAESCDGTGDACPADVVESAGTECRAAGGLCDAAETCDGTGVACPADVLTSAGTECRAAAGACDVAETCSGVDADCPTDVIEPVGTECRASAGICDVAEACDGVATACPADTLVTAGTECRGSAGACDVAEACTGASALCPNDALVASGTQCRASAGACDVAEACDGSTAACPADALATAGTQCRGPAGACDVAESCDGASTTCPADTVVAAGTECRAATGACDVAEACDGSATACPGDVVASAGTTCRGAAGACDVVESCDGSTKACPADAVEPVGTECRPSIDACDSAEYCDGGVQCPVDTGAPDSDGDGTCDAIDNCENDPNVAQDDGDGDGVGDVCDPCTNSLPVLTTKTKLEISRLNTPPGDDAYLLKGEMVVPFPYSPPLDPVANGFRVILTDTNGLVVADETAPAGAFDSVTKRGWKVGGGGKVYTWLDGPAPYAGLRQVQLRPSATTGKIKFLIKAKSGNYAITQAQLPLKATIVVDAPTAETNQCGETAFSGSTCGFKNVSQMRCLVR